ncbi:hypothetical protein ES703_69346 [subsurface metagenome]
MGLVFHSGFETGDFAEWYITGSPEVQSVVKNTGDYALKCDTTGGPALASLSPVTEATHVYRGTVYFRVDVAPSEECTIIGTMAMINIRLTTDRYLTTHDVTTLKDTGSTQLVLGTWYRISWSLIVDNTVKVYLSGKEECSATIGDVWILPVIGIQDFVTALFYFDDFVADDVASLDDIGDIRVVRSQPNADGTNQDFDTRVPADGRPYFGLVDECPVDDADYVARVATGDAEETYGLQGSSTIGLGASDTIKAVSVWCRMKRGGGGATTHQIVVYDAANYETTVALTTDWTWYNKYYATKPGGGGWTQAAFDAFEAGAGNAGDQGQDTFLSCVMVMVAYTPANEPPNYAPRSSSMAARMMAAGVL